MNSKTFLDLVSELEGVSVKDHFGSDGYSAHKRMFMTVWDQGKSANIRLSKADQDRFLALDGEGFTEIENGWGHQGWTRVNLEFVETTDFADALRAAWEYSKVKNARPKSSVKTPKAVKKAKTGSKPKVPSSKRSKKSKPAKRKTAGRR